MIRFNLISKSIYTDSIKIGLRLFCTNNTKDTPASELKSENDDVKDKIDKINAHRVDDSKKANSKDEINSKLNSIIQEMIKSKNDDKTSTNDIIETKNLGTHHRHARKLNKEKKEKMKNVDDNNTNLKLKNAAKAVAETIGDDKEKVEEEIISKALNPEMKILNWGELITGMPVDKSESTESYSHSRAKQVHSILGDRTQFLSQSLRPQRIKSRVQNIDLFGGTPLKIFNDRSEKKDIQLETWNDFENHSLELLAAHPPANYFEKMIKWTKEGKIWKFPIDNEQGLEEEHNVHFSEHVFLETHIEDWCPKKGPIRHFMELVCVGMSKNPYMPVQDKINHIKWFQEYFETHKALLKETGALGEPSEKPIQIPE